MKVLLLAPHPFFQQRGTPIAEKALLEVLLRRGHQVDVLTFHEGEDPRIPGCRVHRIPAPPFVRGLRPGFSAKKLVCDAFMLARCLALVRRERYDLVHAVEEASFMALAARRLFGVPYVYDMDSELARQMIDRFPVLGLAGPLLRWCEGRAVCGSLGVIAVCKSVEERARACRPGLLVARLEDFSLLDSGIGDGALSGAGAGAHAGAGRDAGPVGTGGTSGTGGRGNIPVEDLAEMLGVDGPIVLYVGNLQSYQGIDLLLAGFRRALARVPEAHLVVIGGAPEFVARYLAVATGLGLDGRVHFLGPRPLAQLGDYLRQAAVLASPRIHGENTPMKIYSYLDSGRPIVATRLPTHTQVLDDEVACLTDPDPESFGDGLARLLESEPLRERMGAAARRYAQREFTPAAFEGKLLRFYDEVARQIGEDASHGDELGESQPSRPSRRGLL